MELMQQELNRIGSYNKWPAASCTMSYLALAKAGLYYTGEGDLDEVTCCGCNAKISRWSLTGDPIKEHRRVSPNCPLLVGTNVGVNNIPLPRKDGTSLAQAWRQLTGKELNAVRETPNQNSVNPLPAPILPSSHQSDPALENMVSHAATNDEPKLVNLQEVINRVPKTNKLSQPVFQPNSTDPRKLVDFTFLDSMRSEKERLKTFYDWPEGAWQTPQTLAAAGFFYTGSADRCQCAFCRGVLRNWEPTDVPVEEHRRHYGECPFVRGLQVGNIPLPHIAPNVHEKRPNAISASAIEVQSCGVGLGILTDRPKHPQYVTEVQRITSFQHPSWPSRIHQAPADLAKAGFYYTGISDHVKCFFCDGGLCNWEPDDDPWMEHEKWFPRCQFTRMVKASTSLVKPPKTSIPTNTPMPNISCTSVGQNPPKNPEVPKTSEYTSLVHENEELKEQRVCKVCMDNEVSVVFLPCSHLVTCPSCALALKKCPICRQLIRGTVRIFLS